MRTLLSLGLTSGDIRHTIRALDGAHSAQLIVRAWPTVKQDRRVLEAVAGAAHQFGQLLNGCSPRARAELATATLKVRGAVMPVDKLAHDALQLAFAISTHLPSLPEQSYRTPESMPLVRAFAEAIGHKLPPPSRRDTKFKLACVAALRYVGFPSSPDRAIDRLIRER